MSIDGLSSVHTYFVLNKRNRSGEFQTRSFQHVLEEMTREDMEEANVKRAHQLESSQYRYSVSISSCHHDKKPAMKPMGTIDQFKVTNDKDMRSNSIDRSLKKSTTNDSQSIEIMNIAKALPTAAKSSSRSIHSKTCQLL
jgi:hypothetical protein